MNPGFQTWMLGIYGLLVTSVVCRPGPSNTHLEPNRGRAVGANELPNPCVDSHFQRPAYEFSNVTAVKQFINDNDPDPTNIRFAVNFTVRDTANNYSLQCQWRSGQAWESQDCVPETGPIPDSSRTQTLLNLAPDYLQTPRLGQDPVTIVQYWYCDIKQNQSYPDVYQSRVDAFFNFTCPDTGARDIDYACNATTRLPLTVNSQWQPTGDLPGTPQLIPHPSPPTPALSPLSPPPSKDCTDMSFTHPDWEISNFSYVPESSTFQYETASLNLTLTSRASGAHVICRFGGEDTNVDWEDLILVCSPQTQGLESRSSFNVRYRGRDRWLYVQEDWACGDVHGLYSTNFSANAELNGVPEYSESTSYVAETMTIRGSLTSPVSLTPASIPVPPNADTPNCLARSQVTDPNSVWTLTRFLYQTTQAAMEYPLWLINHPPPFTFNPYNRTMELELLNNANGYTASCFFDDPVLDSVTDKWWPCFTRANHTFPQNIVETYFQFNRDTGELNINQTWYCNDTQTHTPFMITGQASLPRPSTNARLICGESESIAENVSCNTFEVPIYECNVTLRAQWCSLGADRDGRGPPLPVVASHVSVQRMAPNALTDPDPVPDQWSCTVASLGRGPVVWKLQVKDYLALTAWFGHWQSDQTYTKIRFDLNSSVFWGEQAGGGLIQDVGTQLTQFADASAATPWLRGFDPTHTFHSFNRFPETYPAYVGWDFYNALDWTLRFDLTTGYMELNQSWYCDDKNPSTPIIFNGTWNGYIPLSCSYKFDNETDGIEDGIVCLPAGGDVVVTPTVTHTTVATTIPDPKYGWAQGTLW